MKHVKAVFIDVDDTLLDFRKSSEAAINKAAEQLSVILPENFMDIFEPSNLELWKQLESGVITREELFENRFRIIFKIAGVTADGHTFEKAFKRGLWYSHVPIEHALEALGYLSGKYPVYVASNGPYDQQENRLREAGMLPFLSGLFVSERIGYVKPAPEFFRGCFETVSWCAPGESVMIGDSLTSDIAGAKNYGMQTIWFNKKGVAEDPETADETIVSLTDIFALL